MPLTSFWSHRPQPKGENPPTRRGASNDRNYLFATLQPFEFQLSSSRNMGHCDGSEKQYCRRLQARDARGSKQTAFHSSIASIQVRHGCPSIPEHERIRAGEAICFIVVSHVHNIQVGPRTELVDC